MQEDCDCCIHQSLTITIQTLLISFIPKILSDVPQTAHRYLFTHPDSSHIHSASSIYTSNFKFAWSITSPWNKPCASRHYNASPYTLTRKLWWSMSQSTQRSARNCRQSWGNVPVRRWTMYAERDYQRRAGTSKSMESLWRWLLQTRHSNWQCAKIYNRCTSWRTSS